MFAPGENAEQCGFSRAVRANQANAVCLWNGKRNVLEERLRSEGFRDLLSVDDRRQTAAVSLSLICWGYQECRLYAWAGLLWRNWLVKCIASTVDGSTGWSPSSRESMRRHVRCRTVTARDRKLWCGLIRSLDGVPFRRVAHAKDLSTVSLEVPDETFASGDHVQTKSLGEQSRTRGRHRSGQDSWPRNAYSSPRPISRSSALPKHLMSIAAGSSWQIPPCTTQNRRDLH